MTDETISDHDLLRVIHSRHGEDHYLTNVTEETDHLSRSFPPGTRVWIVEHESHTCTHDPRCHWFGMVYYYQGRLTLVKDSEMPYIMLSDLVDRITGAAQN